LDEQGRGVQPDPSGLARVQGGSPGRKKQGEGGRAVKMKAPANFAGLGGSGMRGFRFFRAATSAAILSNAPAGRRRQNETHRRRLCHASRGCCHCRHGPLRRADFERVGELGFVFHREWVRLPKEAGGCWLAQTLLRGVAIRGRLFSMSRKRRPHCLRQLPWSRCPRSNPATSWPGFENASTSSVRLATGFCVGCNRLPVVAPWQHVGGRALRG